MSKIGDLNLQIEEQLADLGYRDGEEAAEDGYKVHIEFGKAKLVKEKE